MSVIVGHTITGYTVAEAATAGAWRRWWKPGLFAAVVANLPDLDFLAGMLAGDADRFHRGPTHSLAAAVVAGIVAGAAIGARRGAFWRFFALTGAVYATHLLVDTVAPERAGPNAGVPLLSPFAQARFASPVPMPDWLYGALAPEGGGPSAGFLATVLSPDTLLAMATEALIFSPLLAVGILLHRRRTGGRRRGPDE